MSRRGSELARSTLGGARWVPRAFVALVAFVVLCASGMRAARAEGLRPADAPRAASKPADPPPVPSEYREVDQDGIRFSYHPSTRDRIRPLFDRASALRAELSRITGAPVLRDLEVRVAAVPAEMVQLAPGDVPASAASVAFFEQRLVVMTVLSPSASSSPLDVEGAFAHALAHVALDEATGGAGVPAWFHEGFAAHVAGVGLPGARALVGAALFGRFLTQSDLSQAASRGDLSGSVHGDLTVAEAADFARFLDGERDRGGAPALARALRRVKEGDPFERAVAAALDAPDAAGVEARWTEDRARRYAFVPVLLALLGAVLAGVGVVTGGEAFAAGTDGRCRGRPCPPRTPRRAPVGEARRSGAPRRRPRQGRSDPPAAEPRGPEGGAQRRVAHASLTVFDDGEDRPAPPTPTLRTHRHQSPHQRALPRTHRHQRPTSPTTPHAPTPGLLSPGRDGPAWAQSQSRASCCQKEQTHARRS